MPIVFGTIVINANIEKNVSVSQGAPTAASNLPVEEIVKQTVEKVMEILEEKKER